MHGDLLPSAWHPCGRYYASAFVARRSACPCASQPQGGGGGGGGNKSPQTAVSRFLCLPDPGTVHRPWHETQLLSCMILYSWLLCVSCPCPMDGRWCVRRLPLPCIAFAWQCFRRSGCVPAEFCKSSSAAVASASAAAAAGAGAPGPTTFLGGNSPASATLVSKDDGTASSLLHSPAALSAASMAPGYVVYDTYMKSKPTGDSCTEARETSKRCNHTQKKNG
jgi:hypothetical protein